MVRQGRPHHGLERGFGGPRRHHRRSPVPRAVLGDADRRRRRTHRRVSIVLLDKLRIDDPVGAISVHGTCGIWGVIAVVFNNGDATILGQIVGIIRHIRLGVRGFDSDLGRVEGHGRHPGLRGRGVLRGGRVRDRHRGLPGVRASRVGRRAPWQAFGPPRGAASCGRAARDCFPSLAFASPPRHPATPFRASPRLSVTPPQRLSPRPRVA